MSVLARRIRRFDPTSIERRENRGQRLFRSIICTNEKLLPLGYQALTPTHWVFAVMVDQPNLLVKQLWDRGFDATTHSSLQPVCESPEDPDVAPPGVDRILRHIVFLPLDPPMPEREIERLGKTVGKLGRPIKGSQREMPPRKPTVLNPTPQPPDRIRLQP